MLNIRIEVMNASHLNATQLESFILGVREDLEVQYAINPELKKKIDEYIQNNEPLLIEYIGEHKTYSAAAIAREKEERKLIRKGHTNLIKRVNPKKRKHHKL